MKNSFLKDKKRIVKEFNKLPQFQKNILKNYAGYTFDLNNHIDLCNRYGCEGLWEDGKTTNVFNLNDYRNRKVR